MVDTGAINKVCAWCINTTYSEEMGYWYYGIFTESIKNPSDHWPANVLQISRISPSLQELPLQYLTLMICQYFINPISWFQKMRIKPKEALDFFLQFLVSYPIWVISSDKSMLLVIRYLQELYVI
jgi:hypothetical protein